MPASSSPRPNGRNVPLDDAFRARLRRLRVERHLSKTDLAERAGVTYRTIHNLEHPKHPRAQQKTLLVVAEALAVRYDDLVGTPGPAIENGDDSTTGRATDRATDGSTATSTDRTTHDTTTNDTTAGSPRPRPRRPGLAISATVVLLVAIVVIIAADHARSRATVEPIDDRLVVRDALLGVELWSLQNETIPRPPTFLVPEQRADRVIVGLDRVDITRPSLQARDRATGRILWEATPDLEQLASVIDSSLVFGATLRVRDLQSIDVDGDGVDELAVMFRSDRYSPTALCLFDLDGVLRAQYAHWGHLFATLAHDVDDDGADEYVASGVHNAPGYGGPAAVMLDGEHWSGGSVDPRHNGWSDAPDSCYARVVLPDLPLAYQKLAGMGRLGGQAVALRAAADGAPRITVDAAASRVSTLRMLVDFDLALRPVSASIGDGFLDALRFAGADSLLTRGPADAAWRQRWMERARRFGAGVATDPSRGIGAATGANVGTGEDEGVRE